MLKLNDILNKQSNLRDRYLGCLCNVLILPICFEMKMLCPTGEEELMEELTIGKGKPGEEDGSRKRAEARLGFGFCGATKRLYISWYHDCDCFDLRDYKSYSSIMTQYMCSFWTVSCPLQESLGEFYTIIWMFL